MLIPVPISPHRPIKATTHNQLIRRRFLNIEPRTLFPFIILICSSILSLNVGRSFGCFFLLEARNQALDLTIHPSQPTPFHPTIAISYQGKLLFFFIAQSGGALLFIIIISSSWYYSKAPRDSSYCVMLVFLVGTH